MLVFLGFIKFENMQIEGFFFYLLAGFFGGATIHYLVAKVAGPLYFNSGWCSWACWTMMVMDLFPWKKPHEGRRRGWGIWRYVHFGVITGVIFWLVYLTGYGPEEHQASELSWLVIGNIGYYVLAIILAALLKLMSSYMPL